MAAPKTRAGSGEDSGISTRKGGQGAVRGRRSTLPPARRGTPARHPGDAARVARAGKSPWWARPRAGPQRCQGSPAKPKCPPPLGRGPTPARGSPATPAGSLALKTRRARGAPSARVANLVCRARAQPRSCPCSLPALPLSDGAPPPPPPTQPGPPQKALGSMCPEPQDNVLHTTTKFLSFS